MKTGRPDYDDQIISVRSNADLRETIVEMLSAIPDADVRIRLTTKIGTILSGPIPADEPVFLLRGQDAMAPAAVRRMAYALGGLKDTRTAELVTAILKQAEQMEHWPVSKLPDVPSIELPPPAPLPRSLEPKGEPSNLEDCPHC